MNAKLRLNSRIMIVDDSPFNLNLTKAILLAEGYKNLKLIQDPREVIPELEYEAAELILLDLNMPHLDGLDVLQQLMALNNPLLPPVFVITADLGRDKAIRALELGARDYITKPIYKLEMLARVRNLLDAHLAHRMEHIHKAGLEDMVRIRGEELDHTRLEMVQRLARAAEYRDNETGLHVARMSQFSATLARSLGWSNDTTQMLLHASTMHDIGKIGIPDQILLKPGKFEPDEWEIMKTHAAIGAEILSDGDSDLLRLAAEIALSHHENWDGSGYPNGLVGEKIPQSARIAAIADVFDALTTARPYKPAWSIDDAVALIRRESGKKFDPEIVEHFMKCLPEILEIHLSLSEPEQELAVIV